MKSPFCEKIPPFLWMDVEFRHENCLVTLAMNSLEVALMGERDYIRENMQSTNPFVAKIYTELNERVEEFDTNQSNVQRASFKIAIIPMVICVLIIA